MAGAVQRSLIDFSPGPKGIHSAADVTDLFAARLVWRCESLTLWLSFEISLFHIRLLHLLRCLFSISASASLLPANFEFMKRISTESVLLPEVKLSLDCSHSKTFQSRAKQNDYNHVDK